MAAIRLITSYLLLSLVFASVSSTVSASGNTSSDSNPGQVRTATASDGTLYLTTTVNRGDTTARTVPATTSASRSRSGSVMGEPIRRPEGFAEDLGSYINAVLGIIIVVSLLLVLLNYILAGFQWITSGGDKGKTEDARNRIVNASIGILILSSSFALLGFVAYILGFESVNDALSNIRRINPA